jgi:hypothetical protein
MARRTPREKPKPPEAPRYQIEGEPFKGSAGFRTVEAAVYNVGGFGPRIIPVSRQPSGALKPPDVKNCIHGRPLIPLGASSGGVDLGDREGYAQLCRLCAFEVEAVRNRREPK